MNRRTDRQADSRETLAKEDDVVRKIPPGMAAWREVNLYL